MNNLKRNYEYRIYTTNLAKSTQMSEISKWQRKFLYSNMFVIDYFQNSQGYAKMDTCNLRQAKLGVKRGLSTQNLKRYYIKNNLDFGQNMVYRGQGSAAIYYSVREY